MFYINLKLKSSNQYKTFTGYKANKNKQNGQVRVTFQFTASKEKEEKNIFSPESCVEKRMIEDSEQKI